MTVRHPITALLALVALLLGAGCGGGDSLAFSAETDDPLYQQGKQLQKQGRNSEALTSFLKVIEKRGEQSSPESHLEAGLTYIQHIKDPVEAIHHFRKYLELEPNSKQAPLVRQRIDQSRRELIRTMPGRPSDDQAVRFGGQEQIDRLQRENDELKAELGRQRGSGPAPFLRTSRGPVEVVASAPAPVLIEESPVKVAPLPPSFSPSPAAPQLSTAQLYGGRQPPTKPSASATKSGPPALAAGKRHTVAPGEGLYRIGLKYGVKPEAIAAVNRDVLPAGVSSKLTPGMELKIP